MLRDPARRALAVGDIDRIFFPKVPLSLSISLFKLFGTSQGCSFEDEEVMGLRSGRSLFIPVVNLSGSPLCLKEDAEHSQIFFPLPRQTFQIGPQTLAPADIFSTHPFAVRFLNRSSVSP